MIYLGNQPIGINQLINNNPNYVETIEGTLANPFGDINPMTLSEELTSFNASAELIVDARALVQDFVYLQASYRAPQDRLWFYSVGAISETNTSAVGVTYWVNGDFYEAAALNAGQYMNIGPYASSLPTLLRIIHHPLVGSLPPAEPELFGGEN